MRLIFAICLICTGFLFAATLADGQNNSAKTVVSGGVLNDKAVSKPQPVYPPIAKQAKASGTVKVRVLVGEDGSVISAKAVSGHKLLRQAAIDAAMLAKFEPVVVSGQKAKVSGLLTYDFAYEK
jgi:protein TonB